MTVKIHSLKNPKTNIDLVRGCLHSNKYGVLAQLFVIDALRKHSEAVAAADPIQGSFINGEAWKGVAQEIKDKMDAFYA